MMRWLRLLLAMAMYLSARPALAYIDAAPTLGKVIKDAGFILVLQVEKVSPDKRVIIYKKVADLKGRYPAEQLKHQITDGDPPREPRMILDWAEPGKTALCFVQGSVSLVCLGGCWYECHAKQAPWWTMARSRPELSLAYFGSPEKLRTQLAGILAGKEMVIATMVHGANSFGVYFDVAFKEALRGKACPVQRVKASLQMPDDFWHIGKDPKFFVGFGPAGPEDVPALTKALKHKDVQVRLEAATDLGLMGPSAKAAVAALGEAIQDQDVLVRFRVAEALLKIDPSTRGAMTTLLAGLQNKEAPVRRAAAQSLANLGADAKPAVAALVERLKDVDATARWAAADALGEIGPEAAAAVPPLKEALKDLTIRSAAAAALGGIGPKAHAAIPALCQALQDADVRFRWAAIGALARIGGPGAKAAVPLLIDALNSGDQRDYYNATLYLSAMGPEAKEALPALRKKTDDLAACAVWSIDPRNGVQGYMLTGLTTDRACDQWFVATTFQVMGSRRKEAAQAVVEAVLDGRLAKLASWAVELILRGQAETTVPLIAAGLKNKNAAVRVRAASLLGQLGPQANSAAPLLTAALKDEHKDVRKMAAEALKQIQPK